MLEIVLTDAHSVQLESFADGATSALIQDHIAMTTEAISLFPVGRALSLAPAVAKDSVTSRMRGAKTKTKVARWDIHTRSGRGRAGDVPSLADLCASLH